MSICVQDQTPSQVIHDAQSARRVEFVCQHLALGVDQNNLTWRKYLSHSHHFLPSAGTSDSNFDCPSDQEVFSDSRSAPNEDSPNQSHSNNITKSVDSLTGKTTNNQVATLLNQYHDSRSSSQKGADLSLTQSKQKLQYQGLLLTVLTAISLTCLQNASPCSGLSNFELYNNFSPVGNNYPIQSYTRPTLLLTSTTLLTRRRRFIFYDDPMMGTMSTAAGSFSQDPSTAIEQPGQAPQSSWTSILNPFGLLGGGQSTPQQNTGGGGDDLDNHIKRILVPRISGTPGNIEVRKYIVNELKKNNYHVELDEFTGSTPVGKVNFANIIASSNPEACRQLVLACHYDSKMMDGFLGAIDSAVPCAMLLKMSDTFGDSFREHNNKSDSLGLRFIFFDGEEAFVQWTQTDSLYGSRHLASKWARQAAPSRCGPNKTELDRIELFVLLDLIGASDTSFVMYNTQLKQHYDSMQRYEKEYLSKSGLNPIQTRRAAAFKSRAMPLDFVEDDHVPFRKRGVPILLLLAHPFPRVWHTVADNYQAIDFPKTRRILHVMEEFVSNYPDGASSSSK